MLLTFLNLHIPVLDKTNYIKIYTFTGLNKTDSELFKTPAVQQKISGAMNVFWLRPLKDDSRHGARHLLKGGSVQDEVMAWEIPACLQGQEEMMWCLLLSQREGRGDEGKKGSADGELGYASSCLRQEFSPPVSPYDLHNLYCANWKRLVAVCWCWSHLLITRHLVWPTAFVHCSFVF